MTFEGVIENDHNRVIVERAWDIVRAAEGMGFVVMCLAVLSPTDGVVLCDRTGSKRLPPPDPRLPYSTHAWKSDIGLHTGHYDMGLVLAVGDFAKRVERGF